MTPLSEESLREKIDDIITQYELEGEPLDWVLDKLVALHLQERQAYGEQEKAIIKMSDKYTFKDGTVFVRQRNTSGRSK